MNQFFFTYLNHLIRTTLLAKSARPRLVAEGGEELLAYFEYGWRHLPGFAWSQNPNPRFDQPRVVFQGKLDINQIKFLTDI